MEKSLVLIKSDGVQRGLVGRIIQRLEDVGMKIVAIKMLQPSDDHAREHYIDVAERVSQEIFICAKDYLAFGPVVALVIEGVGCIKVIRKLVGSTDPETSAPGTIRGDFAHMGYAWGDSKKKSIRNLIHASGSSEEAKREIKLWFSNEELHSYLTTAQKHTFLDDN